MVRARVTRRKDDTEDKGREAVTLTECMRVRQRRWEIGKRPQQPQDSEIKRDREIERQRVAHRKRKVQ